MDFNLFGPINEPEININKVFDVVIIGSGPGGLTAALYVGRYRLDTLLIDKELLSGGQMVTTEWVENYPGFEEPILGNDLAKKMERQAINSGVQVLHTLVESVNLDGKIKEFKTSKGIIKSKTVIISTGAQPRLLNIPGEKEYRGKGVSYCATCDGPFYPDKVIAVAGGGNTALEESLFLAKYAKKIYLIHRRDEFRADKIIQERVQANKKIEPILNSQIKEINFSDENNKFIELVQKDTKQNLNVDAVFIFIGIIPNNELFKNKLYLDDNGYIITDENMNTNISGVYAIGDIRSKELRQIATAVGDGAIAAYSAEKHLSES